MKLPKFKTYDSFINSVIPRPKYKRATYLLYELQPINQDHCGVICLDCGWTGVSYTRHDYKTCPCPNEAMVDGGYDYMRCGAARLDRIQTFKLIPHKDQ